MTKTGVFGKAHGGWQEQASQMKEEKQQSVKQNGIVSAKVTRGWERKESRGSY